MTAPADELDEILNKYSSKYRKVYPIIAKSEIKEAKAALKKYTEDRMVAELERIEQLGYDKMHKTYDYDRIAEGVIERIAEIKANKENQ